MGSRSPKIARQFPFLETHSRIDRLLIPIRVSRRLESAPCRSAKRLVSLSKYIVLEAEKYMAAHGQNVSFPPSVRFLLFPCLVFLGLLLWPTTTTTNFSQPHTLWEIALKIATKDALFGIESKYVCVIKFASIDSIMDNTNNREGLLFSSLKL